VRDQQIVEQGKHSEWGSSFWDCCSPTSICCKGLCCPCILFGQTQQRNKGKENRTLNWDCCGWLFLSSVGGWCCLLQCYRRTKMRTQYGIKGSAMRDFCGSCCCPCCGLVQEEKESQQRNSKQTTQYQSPPALSVEKK
jgi:Cys-rich protein (TIGR01571 family)